MPPLIRKQSRMERVKALLNPYDLLLYLSEELHESAIDEKLRDWTIPIGVAANFVYMIARANSSGGSSGRVDDVFGDYEGRGGSGWLAWFVCLVFFSFSFTTAEKEEETSGSNWTILTIPHRHRSLHTCLRSSRY